VRRLSDTSKAYDYEKLRARLKIQGANGALRGAARENHPIERKKKTEYIRERDTGCTLLLTRNRQKARVKG